MLAILLAFTSLLAMSSSSQAAVIDTTSTSISDSRIGETGVSYTLTLGNITASAIECITIEFDTEPDGSGSLPPGMNITSVGLGGGSTFIPIPASWTPAVNSNIVSLVNTSGETPGNVDGGTIILTGITNGSTKATAYYTVVNTFANDDCTGAVDTNGVASFIFTEGVLITATVDSALSFDITDSDCNLGNLPLTGTHKGCDIDFSVASNSANGWTVSAKGDSAGTNASLYNSNASATITALTTAGGLGTIGAAEAFGFNLAASNTTTPDTGTALSGDTTGVSIASDYNTANTFKWPGTTNEVILTDTGTSPGTNATILVGANRSSVTPSGSYSTILVLTIVASY